MAQISLPPWQEFYDSTRNDIITTTTNSVLNGKLYAMLIIFTLSPEFESIQNNYHIGNLPLAWNTTHWPTLLVICRDNYNLINPKGSTLLRS